MADRTPPKPVKLICGMITRRLDLFARARGELKSKFGPEDGVSDILPFDMTDYYHATMGSPLLRQFVSFRWTVDPKVLVTVKNITNDMEQKFAEQLREEPDAVNRPINLDPGYLTESKLVLASMKDFSHRVYLDEGVYGEVTLQYRKGWKALEWTFPDYASGRYDTFLTAARRRLREKLNQESDS